MVFVKRTYKEAREVIRERGLTVKQWAESNGLDYDCVRNVVQGKSSGRMMEAHRVAVLLGMEQVPTTIDKTVIK